MKKINAGLMALVMVMGMIFGSVEVAATVTSQPNIAVSEQKPIIVYSGTQNTLTYTLTNDSPFIAKNLKVTPDTSVTKLTGFKLKNTTFKLSDTSLIAQRPVTATLEAVVDDTVAEGVYPIKLLITYENTTRDFISREILTYFEVRNDEKRKGDFVVKEANTAALNPVKGEALTFTYKVFNGENHDANHVKTWIDGLPAQHFSLKSTETTENLGGLKKKVQKDVSITYMVKEDTPDGSYPYTINLEYENKEGNLVIRSYPYNLFVSGGVSGKGKVAVSGVAYPSTASQDKAFKVSFDLTNVSERAIEDLTVTLAENAVFIPKSASIIKVDTLEAGQVYQYTAELVATGDSLKNRNYPITFDIAYNNGKEQVTDKQILGVYINAKNGGSENGGNAPKIIISDYKSEPQIVKAGGEFDLSLEFKNTNKNKAIYNVKAYISSTEKGKDTGNVFTPVGSSNTFYIDEIGPKGSSAQSIRLFTVPDAAPKTYVLTINFEYEDKDGKAFTATEYVGIPVTQVTKVEASDFNIASDIAMGESLSIYFDIFNTGKAKVYNLLVKAEGNFTSDPVSKYIGNFEAGSSDYFDAYVTFKEVGPVEGKFVISYEDASGEKFVEEKAFNINVTEPYIPDYSEGGNALPEPMPEPASSKKWPWIAGGAVLLIVIVVVVLRRRKKKKEELMFDENE